MTTPEEKEALIAKIVEKWRGEGEFAYPLNDDGLIARLEDAREAAKIMSGFSRDLISHPIVKASLLLNDPEILLYMTELTAVCHKLTCCDPECGINHPRS